MTVLFSPRFRLDRTRICVTVEARGDLASWRQWCSSVSLGGAGMIAVSAETQVDDYLSAAREGVGRGLVAAVEPVDSDARADVIHMSQADHVGLWPTRLVGCEVSSLDQAYEGLRAGCAYLVADWRVPGLVTQVKGLALRHPELVWFVSGCATMEDLKDATSQGARRVWDPGEQNLGEWSAYLRQIWRTDPTMNMFRAGRILQR